MSKPIILAVDDEPTVAAAVARDLRRGFGKEYRVVTAGSGAEALETLGQLKRRGASLALLLVDQRMPGMEGTQLLQQAVPSWPGTRTVLLTAYADTQAAIDSINEVGLDHYLTKPWDPPEERLFPVLQGLLDDWVAAAPAPFDGIRVAGTSWSAAAFELKDFLARNRVPYRWLDVDAEPDVLRQLREYTGGEPRLPSILLPDGEILVQPGREAVAEKVGLTGHAVSDFYDLIVLGAGPAGLGAGVYGASEGLRTLVVEREATGGQAGTSSRIENYLGFPNGLSGAELATRATTQATRLGAELLVPREAVSVQVQDPYHHVTLSDGSRLTCYALLIATGVQVRRLDVPGADRLTGTGLYYGAALTEAVRYRGQDLLVIGGGNSAGQAALHFARHGARVSIMIRRESLDGSMSRYLIDRIDAAESIQVLTGAQLLEVLGTDHLAEVVIERAGAQETLSMAGVFVFIGAEPRTGILAGTVARTPDGYVLTGADVPAEERTGGHLPGFLETSRPGVFAAGDVRFGSSKRVAAAVGEGAVAVSLIHQYLKRV